MLFAGMFENGSLLSCFESNFEGVGKLFYYFAKQLRESETRFGISRLNLYNTWIEQ